jgi:hypothetical protein
LTISPRRQRNRPPCGRTRELLANLFGTRSLGSENSAVRGPGIGSIRIDDEAHALNLEMTRSHSF